MLKLNALAGFGVAASAPDVTPDAFSWPNMDNAGFTATAMTPSVAITGITIPVTLRVRVDTPLSPARTLTLLRDGVPLLVATAGTTAEASFANGQLLQVELANALDLTLWSGTLTLENLSDAGAVLAACTFSLLDTGSGGGGGGGGGGGEGGGNQP
ncbi:MAG: hypothetical protein ACK52K_00515 [Alphaproteobacteria bacterium]